MSPTILPAMSPTPVKGASRNNACRRRAVVGSFDKERGSRGLSDKGTYGGQHTHTHTRHKPPGCLKVTD